MEDGATALKVYEFGVKTKKHKFCPKCGSSIMAEQNSAPEGRSIAINARMLHDIKLDSLKTVSFDGAALEPLYHAPQASSDLVARDGFKIYHGSSHCGAVTYSVLSELLTETGPPNGYLWIYPRIADVEVHGEDAFTDYIFGQRTIHRFCSVCGSSMFNYPQTPKINMRALNVRTLNELDVKRLDIVRNYKPTIVFFED
ncbi:hypothetical protein MMC22_001051 [Lobaria immixta]|nr:hypothetical protein [Lobaria immixta]